MQYYVNVDNVPSDLSDNPPQPEIPTLQHYIQHYIRATKKNQKKHKKTHKKQ